MLNMTDKVALKRVTDRLYYRTESFNDDELAGMGLCSYYRYEHYLINGTPKNILLEYYNDYIDNHGDNHYDPSSSFTSYIGCAGEWNDERFNLICLLHYSIN
jgi:hypothetical protein